jgi:selenocysteine-specific elongation factor
MRSIIVGTAGHIDHGKTSLVEALTGTNADRLPEERRRGITIDLGFASLDLEGAHLGFVDVPGHERFVRNMLAGAHGIDLVLLIVAADEGVMPQTREHFDICRLLGLRAGIVCLTKQDAADDDLRQLVRLEVAELVEHSFLEGAPVIETSARTGAGLDELKAALARAARDVPERAGGTVTRLPVDRAFAMRGFGTIVTGTLIAGEVRAGDDLELLPSSQAVRARGVQVHGQAVERARAGERTAINLGGIDVHEVERGQVLAAPHRLRPTQVFDARLDVLADAARGLRSRARVRLHHGAAEVLARVAVVEDGREIAPGESGYAQLRLESPLVALPGDRFILRSYSPCAHHRGRRSSRRLRVETPQARFRKSACATGNSFGSESHGDVVSVC